MVIWFRFMKALALVTVLVIGLLGACSDTGTQERSAHAIAAANDSSTAASAAVAAFAVAVEAANDGTISGGGLRGPESSELAKAALLNASAALERAFELAAASVDALNAVDAGTAATSAAADALNAANDAHARTQALITTWDMAIDTYAAGERAFEEARARPDPAAAFAAIERRNDAIRAHIRTFGEGVVNIVPIVQRAKERAEAAARYVSARLGEDAER